jgi:hypothetical protein
VVALLDKAEILPSGAAAAATVAADAADAAAGAITAAPAPAAPALAAMPAKLPPDVMRMIWQRMWRVDSAVCIQRGVRRAIQRGWGLPALEHAASCFKHGDTQSRVSSWRARSRSLWASDGVMLSAVHCHAVVWY